MLAGKFVAQLPVFDLATLAAVSDKFACSAYLEGAITTTGATTTMAAPKKRWKIIMGDATIWRIRTNRFRFGLDAVLTNFFSIRRIWKWQKGKILTNQIGIEMMRVYIHMYIQLVAEPHIFKLD